MPEADDKQCLFTKVALIVELVGACRREELKYLLLNNVKDEGDPFRLILRHKKIKIAREFFVTAGDIDGFNMLKWFNIILALVRIMFVKTDSPSSTGRTNVTDSLRESICLDACLIFGA